MNEFCDASGSPTAEDATQIWIVEAIAPFGGAEEMVKDLKAKVVPEREVRYLATGWNARK
jgi:hemolysin-activating ACP:hemolysin acyltransferase